MTADPRWRETDRYLFNEGRHWRLWEHLGATPGFHDGVAGTWFAVWAPNARAVSVVGDFNSFDRTRHRMFGVGGTGIWSAFVADAREGHRYKYAITGPSGTTIEKADPLARAAELPPRTASVVWTSRHQWNDGEWMGKRTRANPWRERLSIYEVHLGSWRGHGTYASIGDELARYALDMGFTHVELLPVAEHPFGGSWGYQVSSYYAPTARFGDPDGFKAFVDVLHGHGLGVIVDWVPAHFPKDEWSIGRFDGTALYEHLDPRQGEHPDWGTYVFNYGRTEVRNFLIANALYWFDEFHIDGLRVDAVASMLYLDYSRESGEWIPNRHGGRENLDAIAFLTELNTVVHAEAPGALMIAEESTAWPRVSRPVEAGGLGFGFKWNMGWMHDTLRYASKDPVHRVHHHRDLTFGLLYAWDESFVLPISHDEVVHGKGSLLSKMSGADAWQKRATMRALYAWMWAYPGKQLLFMGCELGQWHEWDADGVLDWGLLDDAGHAGVHDLVRHLNRVQRTEPALYENDLEPSGFSWLVVDDAPANVLAFVRWSSTERPVVCVANFSPVVRHGYAMRLPREGDWIELVNTDAREYDGSGVGNTGRVPAGPSGHALVTLPPLGALWLAPR